MAAALATPHRLKRNRRRLRRRTSGRSVYAYVGGQPLTAIDLFGLEKILLHGRGYWANESDPVKRAERKSRELILIERFGEYRNQAGVYQLFSHGNPWSVIDCRGDSCQQLGFPEDIAEILREFGWSPGDPVTFYSCSTGRGDNSIAERFYREYGGRVRAPDTTLWSNQDLEAFGPSWIYDKNPDGSRNPEAPGRMREWP